MARSTLSSIIFLSAINFSKTFQLQLLIKDSLTDLQLLGKFQGSQVEESVFDLVIFSPTRICQMGITNPRPKHNGLYSTHQRLSLMRTCWQSNGLSLAKIRGVRCHCPASPAWWTIKQFTNFTKVQKIVWHSYFLTFIRVSGVSVAPVAVDAVGNLLWGRRQLPIIWRIHITTFGDW